MEGGGRLGGRSIEGGGEGGGEEGDVLVSGPKCAKERRSLFNF